MIICAHVFMTHLLNESLSCHVAPLPKDTPLLFLCVCFLKSPACVCVRALLCESALWVAA